MTKREWDRMSPKAQNRYIIKFYVDAFFEAVIIMALLAGVILMPLLLSNIIR